METIVIAGGIYLLAASNISTSVQSESIPPMQDHFFCVIFPPRPDWPDVMCAEFTSMGNTDINLKLVFSPFRKNAFFSVGNTPPFDARPALPVFDAAGQNKNAVFCRKTYMKIASLVPVPKTSLRNLVEGPLLIAPTMIPFLQRYAEEFTRGAYPVWRGPSAGGRGASDHWYGGSIGGAYGGNSGGNREDRGGGGSAGIGRGQVGAVEPQKCGGYLALEFTWEDIERLVEAGLEM